MSRQTIVGLELSRRLRHLCAAEQGLDVICRPERWPGVEFLPQVGSFSSVADPGLVVVGRQSAGIDVRLSFHD